MQERCLSEVYPRGAFLRLVPRGSADSEGQAFFRLAALLSASLRLILEALLYDQSREACGKSGRNPSFGSLPLGLGGRAFKNGVMALCAGCGWVGAFEDLEARLTLSHLSQNGLLAFALALDLSCS